MTPPSVSAIVVAYGATPLLERAVRALLDSEGVDLEVVVVDNGSTDGSPSRAAALDPSVRVLTTGTNLGFGGACNVAAATCSRRHLLFVNPDVVVDPLAASRLVAVAARPEVGIASASVRLLDRPELLNSRGGAIHFLGLGWAEGFEAPATSGAAGPVAAASGAGMALRREVYEELGGFLAELFLYHEDAELSLRCWLLGYEVRYVPDAVVLHDYDFGRNPGKLGLLERNRLVLVLTCYSRRLLLLVAPALVLFEIGMLALAVAQGWPGEKVRGWVWLLRRRRWLRARRAEVQRSRRRADAEIAPLLATRFTGGQVALPPPLAPADLALSLYWRVVRRWL